MLRLAKLLVLVWVCCSSAWAQNGGLLVTVVDEGDLEVPGATVTLSGEGLIGGDQQRTTAVEGEVAFTSVPPGRYRLVATHEKLVPAVLDGVLVKLNTTTRVTVVMNEMTTVIAETVEDPIDQGKTGRGQVLDRNTLERMPFGQDPLGTVRTTIGTQVGPGTGSGNFRATGASNENTFTIDGFNVTDPVSGTFNTLVNMNAVEQIEMLLGGYLPEVGGLSLGAVMNIVTRTGSNNLSFDSSVYYTNGNWRPRMDERIASDGVTIAPNGFDDSFTNIDVQARVSGPVVRDKAFFMLTYTMQRALIGVSGTPQRRDGEKHSIYGKLTVQPGAAHRFTLGLQMDPATIDNTTQGTPFVKASAQGRQAQGGFASLNRWQWFVSSGVTLDTQLSVQKTFIDTGSVPCTHRRNRDTHQCRPGEAEGTIDDWTPGRVGLNGAYNSVNATTVAFDDRWRVAYGTKLSLVQIKDPLGGMHDLKAGIGGEQLIWSNVRGVNGNVMYVDSNAVRFDPGSFNSYYWLEYSGAEHQRTTGARYDFFIQDSWRPTPNLTVNFGTRYDHSILRNDTGEVVVGGGNFGPRLHVVWDPTQDGKTKLATGYGRYNGSGRLGIASVTSTSGFGSKLYLGEELRGDDASGLGTLGTQEQNYAYNPTRNLNIANERLRNPYTDELIFIAERRLLRDVAISSTVSARFSRNIFEHDERNLVYGEKGLEVIGSRYGDPNTPRYRVRTPRLAKRDQVSWDLALRKVWSDRWLANVSYSFNRALGSSVQSLSGSFVNDAQTQFNYGRILNDQSHVVRGSLAFDLPFDPWTQQVGLFFLGGSGVPVERFYLGATADGEDYVSRVDQRSAYTRLQPFWELSVRLQQQIPVRHGNFTATLEVRNLTSNQASGLVSSRQLASQNRYVVFTRQQPMRIQLGASYEF